MMMTELKNALVHGLDIVVATQLRVRRDSNRSAAR